MLYKKMVFALFLAITVVSCQNKSETDLNVEEFERKIYQEDSFLLDVRTPSEVAEGIIEGATVLDIMSSDFYNNYRTVPKNKTIYIYCRSGSRSGKAVRFFKEQGYTSVFHLEGGMNAWKQSNKKIKKRN
ncbi:rhodanese-like domain-containing protein [Flavicella marina]|uniref:rhodanese-like domain-containing protein n=1 Tax=Flavicella marina TaxID=1475951 RepID=UPI0012658EAC|nr:rhodanese-like domain-containing protein [Flavicella marina]